MHIFSYSKLLVNVSQCEIGSLIDVATLELVNLGLKIAQVVSIVEVEVRVDGIGKSHDGHLCASRSDVKVGDVVRHELAKL